MIWGVFNLQENAWMHRPGCVVVPWAVQRKLISGDFDFLVVTSGLECVNHSEFVSFEWLGDAQTVVNQSR